MIKYLFFIQAFVFLLKAQEDGMDEAKQLFAELHGEAALDEEEKQKEEEPDETKEECAATKQDLQIYQAKQLSKIVLEEQIEKVKARLSDVKVQIESLKYNLPSNEQSDECIQIVDCAACTKNMKCGWCAQEQRCVSGDNVGPLYTMCNYYNFLYCSGDCARFVDCDSCVKDAACGWCEDQPHMIIGCVLIESAGIQCPPDYLIGEGADKCPKRQIEIVRTVTTKTKGKQVKAEEPLEKKAARGWEDQYVMVRQGRYKERMKSLRENSSSFGGAAAQSDLDSLLEEQANLSKKLNKYQKQYKELVAEGEDEGEGGE